MDGFSNRELKNMIVPLFLEQMLVMLVGMADTLIVSYAGEAEVSGVSLVNQFNTIFIYLFTALASGGAVVISQYIGKRERDNAGKASSQLLSFSAVFSVGMMAAVLLGNEPVLRLMFGRVEKPVMDACITYLRISAYSYPALAVYNAGAAVYRSIGKTSTTMYLSAASNVINVAGNLIGVFVLKAGVAGVAYPSLIARVFSAAVITALCFRKTNPVAYEKTWLFRWDKELMVWMLGIAVPNGMENGVFQLVLLLSAAWNLFIFLLTPLFLKAYALEPETKTLVVWLVFIHNVFNAAAFPFSGALSNGLRAAGDVKFTMYISIGSTLFVRLTLSYLFGIVLGLGVIGVAVAMACDWTVRGVLFFWRLQSEKWKAFRVV